MQDCRSGEQVVRDVSGTEPGAGAAGTVVVDDEMPGDPLVPEHEAGTAVPDGMHANSLGA
jgi:hypothetical protein